MADRREVVHELHNMVKEGATVSKCLCVIGTRLGIERPAAIEFFRAAFSLGLSATPKAAGGCRKSDSDNTQRGLATLLVLPMIVQSRGRWDKAGGEMSERWFDSLACSSAETIADKARATIDGDETWSNVPACVREQYLTAERSRLMLSEYAEIMSRLAERLQSRVDELERKATDELKSLNGFSRNEPASISRD